MCVNLGTGNGYSILDLVKTFEKVNNIAIPFEFCNRRKGDIEQIYADTGLAEKLLKWKSKRVWRICVYRHGMIKKQTASFHIFFVFYSHHPSFPLLIERNLY